MILIILLLILLAFYLYSTRKHSYWAKRNVKHNSPIPLFGNHFNNVFGLRSIVEVATELYNQYPEEKVVGYYRGMTPELIIRDLDIARTILSVDFAYFYPRGLGRDIKLEPLLANLFHADGDSWKLLRQRLTPAFTTAKLKAMFPLVVKCAKKMQVVGEGVVTGSGECDVRELMARFTTEFIGACGFGIEVDTINNENSLFRQLGKTIFKRSWKTIFLIGVWELFPELRTVVQATDDHLEKCVTEIVRNICEQRNYEPSGRNDFIDLLLELKTKGVIKGDSIETRNADGTPVTVEMEMDLKCIVAQVFVFFAAGFETSSSASSYTLLQLAYNQEVQRKIQNEIDEVLVKYNNELCYDSISEMSLLSMAFKEAMRMFPSLGNLHRVCARRYTIQDLDITIDRGVKIIVPLQAIQNDEKYFDNPSEFKPERFADMDMKRNNYSYLPFGAGPRACIGARLGEMQSLAGLAALMQKFSVEPAASTRRVPEVDHKSNVIQGLKGGLPMKLTMRKKDL
ncbi:Cytochrome P450 [Operophtera brumata]|uniref:unspecific monooxygenase n=1 Tax=Operophtera brumata TaxID=104452 RepID=A0A0L7KP53_OPEBR|nr:Cytochrome P450 [Operophtera brumata]